MYVEKKEYTMKYITHSVVSVSLLAAVVFLVHSSSVLAQVDTNVKQFDAETQERLKRQADSPFRFIIMNSNINRTARYSADTQPDASKKEPALAKPVSAAKVENRTSAKVPATKPVTPIAVAAKPTTAAEAPAVQETMKTLSELFNISRAQVLSDGSLSDSAGGFVLPTVFTYSEKKPNPAKGKFNYEPQNKKVRVDYTVPESVGYFGGAGVTVFAPGNGLDMSELIEGEQTKGLLVIELGSNVNNRLKISIIGPKERDDTSYPFFILPVEKGVRTYGLELADFRQPPWASSAPDIQQALKNIVAVSVEYARGNANGMADEASFFVGSIRIDLPKDPLATAKK
jgi:hypothetical protein